MIGGIISFVMGLLGLIFKKPPGPTQEAQAAGRAAAAEVVSQVDTTTATKQSAIAQAEVDAPKTASEVVKSLNDGSF